MYGYILTGVVLLSLFAYFIVYPIVYYFLDPKGLRKYPNLNLISGITDLGFVWEANKPFRSNAVLEAHKKSPVIRIGPNSLSYSNIAAIKVRRPFSSKYRSNHFLGYLWTQHYLYQRCLLRHSRWHTPSSRRCPRQARPPTQTPHPLQCLRPQEPRRLGA
jgi:hypothetical protein